MLIDDFMPRYDVVERHRTRVGAPAEAVYAALRSTDFAESPVVRALLALRGLPAALASDGRRWREARARFTLADAVARGFAVLAESPPRELLLGLEGRFWTPTGGLRAVNAATFRGEMPPGVARAAWNFSIEPRADRGVELATETRVRCADAGAARRFRAYWMIVGPWSGVIRRLMLRAIRRRVERGRGGASG